MDYIQWSPFFSVAVEELDEDHRQLFAIVNQFFQHREQGASRSEVFHVLNRLVGYAEQHFAREERLMEQTRFPAFHQHRLEHGRLLEEIFRINALWERDDPGDDSDVVAFLQHWLQAHVLEFDKAYAPHLAAHGGGAP